MELEVLFLVGLPLLTTFAVGLVGSTRRIGFWGGVLFSILLTPLGGFLVTLLSGPRRLAVDQEVKPVPASTSEPEKKKRWFRR